MTSLTATFAESSTTIPLSVEATFLPGWPQVGREGGVSALIWHCKGDGWP